MTMVDDNDYEYLNQWKWHCTSDNYAVRCSSMNAIGKRTLIYMHVAIMPHPEGMKTDHKNHNTLDNRRPNLRICTHSQNLANSVRAINNSSGRKGVCWKKQLGKWCVQIGYHGKRMHVGYYDSIEDATNAYSHKAKELFGEFAYFD
jgi:hypothetical protein